MIVGQYVYDLEEDFAAQGLGRTGRKNLLGYPTWNSLRDVLALTMSAGSEVHHTRARSRPGMRTELGQLMLEYAAGEDAITFCRGVGYTACAGAERYLISNVHPNSVKDDRHISPVVVVDNDRAVSIIKGWSERTSYGLRTNMAAGILAGAFSEAPHDILMRMRPAEHPFYLDVKQHGVAALLRIGGFLVPQYIRVGLEVAIDQGYVPAPIESHEDLIRRAEELLMDAKPLPLADAVSVASWNSAEAARYSEF